MDIFIEDGEYAQSGMSRLWFTKYLDFRVSQKQAGKWLQSEARDGQKL